MSERDVYHTPADRVLLRTADVYQTEAQDDVTSYSDKLLAIVADFKNSGEPEGANAQAMVGKSKRGEVACRLFARVDADTGIIQAAGFKARGCLAMTACASATCLLIEGKGIEEALKVGMDEIRACVDGVPADKQHTLHFAACAVRALVGDFLLRDGATAAELDEAVPCDEGSISCIMAEHCSYRQSRLELRLDEAARAQERARVEAVADVMDLVRKRTARGQLTSCLDWKELVPASLMPDELTEAVLDALDPASASFVSSEPADMLAQEPAQRSPFANRGVGVPQLFKEPSASAGSMPETKRALEQPQPCEDDGELRVPEGYELREVDGNLALVQVSATPARPLRTIDATGIVAMEGSLRTYLYDSTQMKPAFARWAFLAAEDDPLFAFVSCVREDSRVYPRPMAASSLTNHPFDMTEGQVEALWVEAKEHEGYEDIGRVEASNGDAYFYSSRYLSEEHARSLAEWESVERLMNV